RLGGSDDFVEHGRFVDGQFAEHLAVHFDPRQDEGVHELGVPPAAGADGSSDPGDPQSPEVTLADAAVAEGVSPRTQNRFANCSPKRTPSAPISLGLPENAVLLATTGFAVFYSHVLPQLPPE